MKAMLTPQEISVLEVCIYPKAHPWNSVNDPNFTGSLSLAEQSSVSLDFVHNLFPGIYFLPPCPTHLVFLLCVLFIWKYLLFFLISCNFMLIR